MQINIVHCVIVVNVDLIIPFPNFISLLNSNLIIYLFITLVGFNYFLTCYEFKIVFRSGLLFWLRQLNTKIWQEILWWIISLIYHKLRMPILKVMSAVWIFKLFIFNFFLFLIFILYISFIFFCSNKFLLTIRLRWESKKIIISSIYTHILWSGIIYFSWQIFWFHFKIRII